MQRSYFQFRGATIISMILVASMTLRAGAAIIPSDSGLIPVTTGESNSDFVNAWTSAEGSPPINAAADLLIHHLTTSPSLPSNPNFNGSMDFSSNLSNINDGLIVSNGGTAGVTSNMAAFSPGGNLVFQLDGLYAISQIDSFTAYLGVRAGQSYTLSGSSNGGASWNTLATVNFDNNTDLSTFYMRGISVTDNAGGPVATVNALRFTFANPTGDDGNGGEAVYAEISAYGQLVPEPATNVLLGFGAIGLGIARLGWRKAVARPLASKLA